MHLEIPSTGMIAEAILIMASKNTPLVIQVGKLKFLAQIDGLQIKPAVDDPRKIIHIDCKVTTTWAVGSQPECKDPNCNYPACGCESETEGEPASRSEDLLNFRDYKIEEAPIKLGPASSKTVKDQETVIANPSLAERDKAVSGFTGGDALGCSFEVIELPERFRIIDGYLFKPYSDRHREHVPLMAHRLDAKTFIVRLGAEYYRLALHSPFNSDNCIETCGRTFKRVAEAVELYYQTGGNL